MESPQVPAVCSHPHSIPRWDQVFFFSEPVWGNRLGGLSAWPHWGPRAGLLAADLMPFAESAAVCWAVGGRDFCGFTLLVLFSVT